MEALADTVCLRVLDLSLGVIDVLDREVQLELVPVEIAALLGAAIDQYSAQGDPVLLEERHNAIVEQISRA